MRAVAFFGAGVVIGAGIAAAAARAGEGESAADGGSAAVAEEAESDFGEIQFIVQKMI